MWWRASSRSRSFGGAHGLLVVVGGAPRGGRRSSVAALSTAAVSSAPAGPQGGGASSSHAAKRFYKETSIRPCDAEEEIPESNSGGQLLYEVLLDGRVLRTPGRARLRLPSRGLAVGVAAEWDSQDEFITPAAMPLTSLAATAIDQIARERDFVLDTLLKYAATDTTCYLAGEADEPRLHHLQLTHYLPLLEHVKETYGARLEPGFGIAHRPLASDGGALETLRHALSSRTHWDLAALQCATQECKSLVIGLALLDGVLDADRAERAARLEEQVQIDRWGFVEGSHDYDVTRIKFRLASAALFADECASS